MRYEQSVFVERYAFVESEFSLFYDALAEKLVNDKTDISAALSKVLEKYPVFKADKSKPAATGVHTETTHDTDDSALRKAFGLPPKK